MKIIKKVMIIFITMCILLNIMQGTTKAATFPSFSEIVSSGKDWVDKGKNEGGDKVFSDDVNSYRNNCYSNCFYSFRYKIYFRNTRTSSKNKTTIDSEL